MLMPCAMPALIGPLGTTELIIIGLVGLLLFGRRLPEVGRNMGKFIIEFKRGLSDVKDDVNNASLPPPPKQDLPGSPPATEPPTSKPAESNQAEA